MTDIHGCHLHGRDTLLKGLWREEKPLRALRSCGVVVLYGIFFRSHVTLQKSNNRKSFFIIIISNTNKSSGPDIVNPLVLTLDTTKVLLPRFPQDLSHI